MSWCLHKTNQSNDDYSNDPYPEADLDDEDRYFDEDRMSFIKNLKPVGNSFALVRKSNGDPTYLIYEGLSDGEDCVNDSDRRITRSFTRKFLGSNSLSHNVSPCGLAKKPKNDHNINGADTKRVGLNRRSQSVRPRTNKKPGVIKKVGGDGHSGEADKVLRGLAKKQKNDQDNGASYDFRPRRNHNFSVVKKIADHGRSGKADSLARGLAKKHRRLSGSRYKRGWAKRRKNAEKKRVCIMETQRDQGNGAEKEISCKVESLDDQDYGDSNRAYGIWLRNYIAKICHLENGNVETSSDSELEVLDKDPQCSEWKYTPLADPNVLDTSMEDDDLQYIGECGKPENPQFRKNVEDIFGRPYDEKEYETLWLQVNSRKPMQGYRELRGHLKAYSKDAMGKSYLDEYLDLRIKLDTFETDLPRKLNVLRGFFYYLKNIASDGIFKPWLDESCLAIVPTTEQDSSNGNHIIDEMMRPEL